MGEDEGIIRISLIPKKSIRAVTIHKSHNYTVSYQIWIFSFFVIASSTW